MSRAKGMESGQVYLWRACYWDSLYSGAVSNAMQPINKYSAIVSIYKILDLCLIVVYCC
jgi:hypothetical protein